MVRRGVNLRTGTPSATELRRAARDVLENEAYRTAARNLQSAYARRDGVAKITADPYCLPPLQNRPVTSVKQQQRILEGMTRDEITNEIIAARLAKSLTWQQLADAIDRPVVWTTSALLGQHPIPAKLGAVLVELLGLDDAAVLMLAAVPMRGGLPTAVPTDPTIYRFYEALSVYGGAIKELIHEQFGDGIMSAINFSLDIEKKSHPAGDRVVVTFDGKFLPYDWTAAPE